MRLLLLASILALAACEARKLEGPPAVEIPPAGSAAASTAAPGVASVEELRRLLRPLECARDVRCGWIGASERKACEEGAEESPIVEEILERARQGNYAVDLSRAGACLAAWKDRPCHPDFAAAPPECDRGAVFVAMKGAVSPGGRCTRSKECAGGHCSAQPGCTGTCVAHAKLGAPCDTQPCGDGAYCHEGTCRLPGKAGESCDGHWQGCAGSLWCQGYVAAHHGHRPQPARPGVCAPRKGEGTPCATDASDEHCRADLFCDWGANEPTCRARLPRGADCGWLDACADGLTCAGLGLRGNHPRGRRYGVAARGRCVPFADAGGACDPAAFVTGCPTDMLCDDRTRTCRRTGNLGDPCESSWVPPGTPQDRPIERRGCRGDGYCDPLTHTCARMARVGEACTPPRLGVDDNPCWISSCDEATRRCAPRCSN